MTRIASYSVLSVRCNYLSTPFIEQLRLCKDEWLCSVVFCKANQRASLNINLFIYEHLQTLEDYRHGTIEMVLYYHMYVFVCS